MTLDTQAVSLDSLHPHLAVLCDRAGERALEVHADEVAVEHLLDVCMEDEDCAAYEAASHAFADPETVSFELRALSPGVMVVGSEAALPFSTRAVEALESARERAIAAKADQVESSVVLRAACEALGDEASEALNLSPTFEPTAGADGLDPNASLFRGFSEGAKRALSKANKLAAGKKERSISPAQLIVALVAGEPQLAEDLGVSATAIRERLRSHTLDSTPPPPRTLPPSADLLSLLAELPRGADSLDLWRVALARGGDELRTLGDRHKITSALLERAREAFSDPA